MAYTIVLDAGHGGANPGATYNGRQEKTDALNLTLAVGRLLENPGRSLYEDIGHLRQPGPQSGKSQ